MSAIDQTSPGCNKSLQRGPFSNRSFLVKTAVYVVRPGHGSLRGQHELPQHLVRSGEQALQGPQRAYVDTRPPARRAIACTLALGQRLFADLTSFDELRCISLRCPTKRLARSPNAVQDHGQLARQGHPCLARTRASLDRLGPILQV
jgi:hypothetical protein